MTDTAVARREADADQEAGLELAEESLAAMEPLMMAVPEAGGDASGYDSILRQIASAQDATQLDAPWRAGGLQEYRDLPLIVQGVRRMPSEYSTGLGWFLIADAVVKETGERVAVTFGSIGPVAQLVKAYQLGALPLEVIPRRAKKASKAGYYAWHLEIVR